MELVTTILQREGFEVASAHDGKAALDLLNHTVFDIIVTDLRLDGMQGMEIIQRMKDKQRGEKIIAVSGKGESFLKEALDAGADAVIPKPFRIDQFIEVVESCLNPTDS